MGIAQWQIEMAARRAPAVAGIVGNSTPVVSFGDPLRAEVATLGINPSRREFFSRDGVLLSGPERRLATADSLGAVPGQALTADQARQVVADCNDYFGRSPYEWFKPLEALLNQALDVSYHDRTACHLDLIQWATDPGHASARPDGVDPSTWPRRSSAGATGGFGAPRALMVKGCAAAMGCLPIPGRMYRWFPAVVTGLRLVFQ